MVVLINTFLIIHDNKDLLMSDDTDERKEYGTEPQKSCFRCDCVTELCGFQQGAHTPAQQGPQVEVSI